MKLDKLLFITITLLMNFSGASGQQNDRFKCEDFQPGMTIFKAPKGIGYYSSEGQLLYVSSNKFKEKLIQKGNQSSKVCVKENLYSKVELTINQATDSNSNDKIDKTPVYNYSLILLLYIFILVIIYKVSNGINLVNPFVSSDLPATLNIPLLFIIAFLCSFIFEGEFITKFGLILIIVFFYKFLLDFFIIKFLNVEMEIGKFTGVIFKYVNIFFLGLLALKLMYYQIGDIDWLENLFMYILLGIFIIHTIRIFLISRKNIKISQLIYYLCALEILPVLFLKEYYIS